MNKTLAASSALIGTIIGAGILGIPFVIMRSGFQIGLFHLVLVAALMIITMLYLGETILRTKQTHQLTGYASKYLGKKGKILMFIAFAFGIYAALLAYLIGEGKSLSHLFFGNAAYSLHFALGFWIILTAMTYFGLKALEEGEFVGVILITVLIGSIVIASWNKIDPSNLYYINPENFFLPFGVILFAFLGFAAVPEVMRILGKERKSMKTTIWISNLIVFALYTLFAFSIVGWKGLQTPQIATLALGKIFILLGILTMLTSYLGLSIALIDSLRFDFKKTRKKAWLFASITPLILYLFLEITKKAEFVKVLGIGGVISGGLTAALILFMAKKAKKKGDRKPEYTISYSSILTWTIIAIFTLGVIMEIKNYF